MKRQAAVILMVSVLLITDYASAMAQPNANGTTRADYKTLAARYEQEAQLSQGKTDEYRKMLELYEKPGNGNYATEKGGLLQQLRYLVRKYQKDTEENLALAARYRQEAAVAQR
jgi:hypothetical protein